MIFGFDEFELDLASLELTRTGTPIKADARVLRLLGVLVRNAGELLTKQDLVTQVWDDRAISETAITVTITRLRKTLGQYTTGREFVTNVHGRGYRFMRPVRLRVGRPSAQPGTPAALRGSPTFVGRDAILERLRDVVHSARDGNGSACALIGDPGIGKTRTLEMAERAAVSAGAAVAWGYCREAGDTPPLWPLARLAREVLARCPLDTLGPRLGQARVELQRLWPDELGGEVTDRRNEPTEYPTTSKHRIFDAIARLFELASEHVPWVLVLDDLHHADSATLDFLHRWIAEIARTRITLLTTLRTSAARSGGTTHPHLTFLLGHRNCERIWLSPLSAADVAAYVGTQLEDPEGRLAHAVYTKSEGNPFFMVELSRQLRVSDRADASLLTVPDAALELVRQRVAGLDAATGELLSCAAVIGRSFELPVLQAISARSPDDAIACLDGAIDQHVVVANPDSKTGFSFGHELLREVFYDALSSAERRRLHLRVAVTLEQRLTQGIRVSPTDLAFHFYAALPETDLRKTVKWCSEASIAAIRVHANSEVVSQLRRALEALDLIPDSSRQLRYRLLLRQAIFLRTLSSNEFVPVINEVLQIARELESGELVAPPAMLLDMHPGFAPVPGVRRALEEALRLLHPENRQVRAPVLSRMTTIAPLAYDAREGRAVLAHARELSGQPCSGLTRFAPQLAELYLTGGPENAARSSELLIELERLCQENPTLLTVAPALLDLHRLIVAAQKADFPALDIAIERLSVRCRELNHRELIWHVERYQLLRQINAGHFAQSAPALEALHRRSEQDDILGTELFCAYDRCVVLCTGVDAPGHALALGDDDPPSVWSMKLRALTAASFHDRARALLARVPPERIAALPCDRDHLGTLAALTRVVLELGADAYVEPLYAQLARFGDYFGVHLSMVCEGSVTQLLGMLAWAMGRRGQALEQLQESIAQNERAGLVACAAQARLDLAHCLSQAGSARERQRATALDNAARTGAALGALPRPTTALRAWDARNK